MNQVEVDIINIEVLQRRINAVLHTVMPSVVELGRDPDFLAGDSRITNTLADLRLVTVCQCAEQSLISVRSNVDRISQ